MVSRSSVPPRIVVVDDDTQIRDLVSRCLIEFGASVTLCEDAFAAIEAIKKVRPDVVLVDLVMPGRYGLDLESN
jgi:CheY-like chemotaxis protein